MNDVLFKALYILYNKHFTQVRILDSWAFINIPGDCTKFLGPFLKRFLEFIWSCRVQPWGFVLLWHFTLYFAWFYIYHHIIRYCRCSSFSFHFFKCQTYMAQFYLKAHSAKCHRIQYTVSCYNQTLFISNNDGATKGFTLCIQIILNAQNLLH